MVFSILLTHPDLLVVYGKILIRSLELGVWSLELGVKRVRLKFFSVCLFVCAFIDAVSRFTGHFGD